MQKDSIRTSVGFQWDFNSSATGIQWDPTKQINGNQQDFNRNAVGFV